MQKKFFLIAILFFLIQKLISFAVYLLAPLKRKNCKLYYFFLLFSFTKVNFDPRANFFSKKGFVQEVDCGVCFFGKFAQT